MSKFNKGDYVTINYGYMYITQGKIYEVLGTHTSLRSWCVEIRDDAGNKRDIADENCTLVPTSQPVCTSAAHAPTYYEAQHEGEDDDLTYDQRKAAASVYSTGIWHKGQVLVYCDGTPTMTTLTVRDCTATCVWFDETYSAPFNPTEFEAIDYE